MPLPNNATLPAPGCLDSFQLESVLPLAFTVVSVATFIVCYWMIRRYHLQDPNLPIASLGEKSPSYWVFAIGLTTASLLLAATVGLQSRNMSRCGTKGVQPVSIASMVIGLIACPALALTGWVSIARFHTTHIVLACIAIGCLNIHCFMSAINSQFAGVGLNWVIPRLVFSGLSSFSWTLHNVAKRRQVAAENESRDDADLPKLEGQSEPAAAADAEAQLGPNFDKSQRSQEELSARITFHAAMAANTQWSGFACIMVALSLTAGSNLM